MQDVVIWFREGGVWMYIILALDVIGLPAVLLATIIALVGRVRGTTSFLRKAFASLVVLGSFLPVIVGLVGWILGRIEVQQAVGGLATAGRAELLARGLQAAAAPFRFGGISTVLLGLGALVALALLPWSARRPRR